MGTALERLSAMGSDTVDDPLSDLRQLSQSRPLLVPLSARTTPQPQSNVGQLPAFARTASDQTSKVAQGLVQGRHSAHDPNTIRGQLGGMIEDMITHPDQTILQTVIPNIPGLYNTVKDVAQYGGQRAAELSLPAKERAIAEADPNRILGARAAVEAGMLTLPALIHGGIKGYHNITDYGNAVPSGLADFAKEAPAFVGPPDAAQAGLPFRAGTTRGLALARAEEIANRQLGNDPLAALQKLGEDADNGIKFTEGRAAAAIPPESRILTPSEASAQPSGIITPEAQQPSQLASATPEPQPTTSPLYDRFGTPIEESPNVPTGRYDAKGIGRRPGPPQPIEPGLEAQTQSFGSRVGRRPAASLETSSPSLFADLIPETTKTAPIEPPPTAETISAAGTPTSGIEPLVSASPSAIEARPGVIREANKTLPEEPAIRTPAPPVGSGNTSDVTGTQSFEGVQTPVSPSTPEPRPSDILNVAKLNLEDQTAQQRVANQLEQFRSLKEQNRQTFAEADINRAEIVKELTANDPKALAPAVAKRLSGEELLARRDVVRQNDQLITELSKSIESKQLSVADHEQATQLMQKALEHNDALLSDLVTGSSQKGRDLNLLRRIADRNLDPDVWQIQAKRMLGDKPLTDEISASIRKLSQAAIDACGGA